MYPLTLFFRALAVLAALVWAQPPCVAGVPQRFTITPQFEDPRDQHSRFLSYRAQKRPRVALVLSGGGARGVAQIGVLKALERHGIPVDYITGTSLGAIVGGLYASGYTTAQLEDLALSTDWDDVLSLTEEIRRSELFMDQKLADDRSFLALRFQGLEPVFPSAVSSGQRLTNFLSEQTLQALYHPDPDFDDLKIRFCAVTTDLISGRRVALTSGSLSEALRASATVPLLFSPIERDSMQLLDGGLVTNIPVDIPRSKGYDIVIVVNSTSGLRSLADLNAPWKTADQIMGIMMQLSNEQQLKLADLVITPDIGNHLSSDFTGLTDLIVKGDSATELQIDMIQSLLAERQRLMLLNALPSVMGAPPEVDPEQHLASLGVAYDGPDLPGDLDSLLRRQQRADSTTLGDIVQTVEEFWSAGICNDVAADVDLDSTGCHVRYRVTPNTVLRDVVFEGARILPAAEVHPQLAHLVGHIFNYPAAELALHEILRLYRARGYSLARVEKADFTPETGILRVQVNEGFIDRLDIQGGIRTQDAFVLQEFPLHAGDIFEIGKANAGLNNLNSTRLFEYVYLEVSYPGNRPLVTIRLKERPSQLVRLGVRIDNERNLQGSLDIRDENFRGSGGQLGLTVMGGARNREFRLEYRANRLFGTYLTYGLGIYSTLFDTYVYGDVPGTDASHVERERVGEYRDIRNGGRVLFGTLLERLGTVTLEYDVERARIRNLENSESLEENYLMTLLRVGTAIDTKDSYPFPGSGMGFTFSFESSTPKLGSEVSYNALRLMYESYATWADVSTFHPRITIGFADRTMPLGQQFRLGGRELFFGLNEDDRRGRQILLLNLEYRLRLPVRLLFTSYLRFRYDLASISSVPEEIKFSTFRHGIGIELALDTPLGQAALGIGKSFSFVRDLPENPLQTGPFLLTFMIGYQP
jgi:NTE family protein